MAKTKITEQAAQQAMKEWLDADVKLQKLQAEKREKVTPIVQKYETFEREHSDKKKEAEEILEAWATQNRDDLFANGKKSTDFNGGKIGFKTSPAKLTTAAGIDWDTVLEKARQTLPEFVLTKDELDKSGILRNASDIADKLEKTGLVIEQTESFYVKA